MIMLNAFIFGVLLPASIIALVVGLIGRSRVVALRAAALYFFIIGGIELSRSIKIAYALFITSAIILGSIYIFKLKKYNAYLAMLSILVLLAIIIAYVFTSTNMKSYYEVISPSATCIEDVNMPYNLQFDTDMNMYWRCSIEFTEKYNGLIPLIHPTYFVIINGFNNKLTPLYIPKYQKDEMWNNYKNRVFISYAFTIHGNITQTQPKLCYKWDKAEYYSTVGDLSEHNFYKCLPIRMSFKK